MAVDRSDESCRTPKNNEETMEAEIHLKKIGNWCSQVSRYFIAKQKNVNILKLQDNVHTGLNQDGMSSISKNVAPPVRTVMFVRHQ